MGTRAHVLGVASTGHGASLAYIGPNGVHATVLDRWARTKHTLLLSRRELDAIAGRVDPRHRAIRDLFDRFFGGLPPVRLFEDDFAQWVGWFLGALGLAAADIDLVVTTTSYFAVSDVRGPALESWFPNARVHRGLEHHEVHQRQAIWGSGLAAGAVVTLDTRGEDLERLGGASLCGTLGRFSGAARTPRTFQELRFPEASGGRVYSVATRHLGFRQGQEGKTMGLAPYGEPPQVRAFGAPPPSPANGFALVDDDRLEQALRGWTDPIPFGQRAPRGPGAARVARAAQEGVQELVAAVFTEAVRRARSPDLVYAGGVALNSVANEVAIRRAGVRSFYAAPNPGDTGHALGLAFFGAYELGGARPPAERLLDYLGPPSPPADVAAAAARLDRADCQDVPETVAQLLARGHVVARCAGRAEFGPRALGNRSILADPRRRDVKDHLNREVKFREAFRPYAPVVLAAAAPEWFDLEGDSPFMLRVVPVLEAGRELVPGIVHVDGSARVQTVTPEQNPGLAAIVEHFGRLTGVPMLLNTSFNVAGQPIVETPAEAVACFESTALDALLLEGALFTRRPLAQLLAESRPGR